jgi:hypothetical protein
MSTAREQTTHLADLLRREHHALAEFLLALARFDEQKLWIELGYGSLFDYLRRELELSKAASFYRMTAARVVQRHPEVMEPLRDGRLCFTSIVELAKVLTAENAGEVLPRFFHLSKREAKAVTAELRPATVVPTRTVVTAIATEPEQSFPAPPAPREDRSGGTDRHQESVHPGEPEAEANRASATPVLLPTPNRPRLTEEPLTADLTRVHITVPRRVIEKLAAAKAALSHSHPNATDADVLEVGLGLIIQRHAKRRGIGAIPRKETPDRSAPAGTPPLPAKRSRHVPAAVWRAVWERDKGCCAWPLEGGGVCGSTRLVELDHVDGWALGGDTTVERCRLLCRPHQVEHARRLYGDEVMDRYTRHPKGGSCSEPVAPYAAPARRMPRSAAARCLSPRAASPPRRHARRVVHQPIVLTVDERRRDQEVCGRAVAGDGNVVEDGDAQERAHVGLVRMGLERIPEEDEHVELARGDERADLLVTAERAALEPGHLEVPPLRDEPAGGPRGDEVVLAQDRLVVADPREQVFLAAVVRDERDPLLG